MRQDKNGARVIKKTSKHQRQSPSGGISLSFSGLYCYGKKVMATMERGAIPGNPTKYKPKRYKNANRRRLSGVLHLSKSSGYTKSVLGVYTLSGPVFYMFSASVSSFSLSFSFFFTPTCQGK